MIQLYELTQDIVSPQFTRTIEKGRLFTRNQVKSMFKFIEEYRFNEFFVLSEKYEIVDCKIKEIVKPKIDWKESYKKKQLVYVETFERRKQ